MSLPVTPNKTDYNSSSAIHSILRSPHCRSQSHLQPQLSPCSIEKTSPQSQVRFSIPQQDDVCKDDASIQQSPTRIVFPNSSSAELNNHGHLVDMHSRIMLDVPENIWTFHTKNKSHSRQKSMQDIIADTLASVNSDQKDIQTTPASQKSTISQVSPLNLRPQSQLYLAQHSPLNSYKVPVPLEISLPPYLSPKNKQKKRSSLIFDGDGYSEYHGHDSILHLDSKNVSETSVSEISNNSELSLTSIPSAEHDLSLNMTDCDFGETLGIDEDANVNLKLQTRNLKRNQTIHNPQENNSSLQILASPSKLIQIPDLSLEYVPKNLGRSSNLYNESNLHHDILRDDTLSPGKERGKLDQEFVFPKGNQTQGNEDFLKVDSSPTSRQFENVREERFLQSLSCEKGKGHSHRRSRSIHQVEDFFTSTSTPPKIPERSSLRSHSPASNLSSPKVSSPMSPQIERAFNPSKSDISPSSSKDSSSIYEDNGNAKKEQKIDTPQSIVGSSKKVTPQESIFDRHESKQEEVVDESDVSLEIISEHLNLESEKKPVKIEGIKSEINGLKIEPLSVINSFNGPSASFNFEDVTSTVEFTNKEYINLLSPRRSLSNVGSDLSRNSQFSKRTEQSNATSQPQDSFGKVPLKNNAGPYRSNLSGPDNLRSVYEVRDGNITEVLVIDDEFESCSQSVSKLDPNYRKRSEKHANIPLECSRILQLCEDAANQAKNVIIELIEEDCKNPNGRKIIPKQWDNTSARKATKQFPMQSGSALQTSLRLRNKNESYLSRLDRAMKVQPLYEP